MKRRHPSIGSTATAVALVTLVVALVGGSALLIESLFRHDASLPSPVEGLAFTVPMPAHAPGIAVSAAIRVDECDPWVRVEVVGEEPIEFWRAFKGRRRTPVAFAVLGSEVRQLELGVAELGDPLLHSSLVASSEPSIRPGELRVLPEEQLGGGAAAGATVEHWGASRVPLKASFEARWASPSGFHECALHIPPIIGGELGSEYVAGDGYLAAHVPGYTRRLGREALQFASLGHVEVLSDFIDRGESTPPPRITSDGATYVCAERHLPAADFRAESIRPIAAARSRRLVEIRSAADENRCNATVALRDSVHDRDFNLGLLLVGILLSLAAALAVELIRVPLTARRAGPKAKGGPTGR